MIEFSDDRYVFVFIRIDLPESMRLVHACHAVHHATKSWMFEEIGCPSVVLIGIRSEHKLNEVRQLLTQSRLPYFAWSDPDEGEQLLSIATGSLSTDQKKVLAKYRLYRGSSEKEHSVSNGGVAGSSPAHGAISAQ